MRNIIHLRRQNGDTIVEVLIATAILSTVLAGAYITANRSLTTERDAQEHAQALTIGQGQIEDLYSSGVLSSADSCFNSNTGAVVPNIVGDKCFVDSSGKNFYYARTCPAGVPYCYQITDKQASSTTISVTPLVSSATYETQITWPALTGATDSVALYYRPQ